MNTIPPRPHPVVQNAAKMGEPKKKKIQIYIYTVLAKHNLITPSMAIEVTRNDNMLMISPISLTSSHLIFKLNTYETWE